MEKILPSRLSLKYERKYFIDTIKKILLLGNTSVVSSFKKVVNNIQNRKLNRPKLLPEGINSA